MFFKNLQFALRSIGRNKNYALINILGLAIGVASCILIFLVVRYEGSFDNFHSKKDRIYLVTTFFSDNSGSGVNRGTPFPLPEALRKDHPQLEKVAALYTNNGDQITITDPKPGKDRTIFNEGRGVFFIEPQFFEMFDFPWLAGDPSTGLSEPYTAALTQEVAERYFGDWKSAIGKTFQLNNRRVFKITGILKNIPVNTDFPFKILISYKSLSRGLFTDWVTTYGDHNCFVLLPPNMSSQQFDALLPGLVKKYKPADRQASQFRLQPMNDIHYSAELGNYNARTFSQGLIKSLILIGIFLLVIACVNYINLATGQSIIRSKEIGVRKVLGSGKSQIILQFLTETFLLTLFAVILAFGIAMLVLPFMNNLLGINLSLNTESNLEVCYFLIATSVVVTLLSGSYPAFVLSRFNPIVALRNKLSTSSVRGLSVRRGLVVMQFVIAQTLVIGTLVVVNQANYFKNADAGFDAEAIVNLQVPVDSLRMTKMDVLKSKLFQNPNIQNVSFSYTTPMSNGAWYSDFNFDNNEKRSGFEALLQWADPDYFKTYKLELAAGRIYFPSDTVREFVVNETFVKRMGLTKAADILNKPLSFWDGNVRGLIVGVVKDYHTQSLQRAIDPVVLSTLKNSYLVISVKLSSRDLSTTLPFIEKNWHETFPDYAYEYTFIDDQIASFYRQEKQLSTLYQIFAAIAIFIACLGLYGLVSFMVTHRVKEMGIRKVLGASVSHILYLFSREFILLVTISFVIAAPIAYFIMQSWLRDFVYRVELTAGIFLLAILITWIIALLTVALRSLKTALANPVKSLRTE